MERVDEHAKPIDRQDYKLALSQHQEQSGHRLNNSSIIDKIKVLENELRDLHRKVIEVVHIKLRGATLNRNDKYDLQELYMPLLREDIQWGSTPLTTALLGLEAWTLLGSTHSQMMTY